MNEEELLLHYGVKGMKWGVRRARNRVGSVTRGVKDYAKVAGTTSKNSIKNPIASDKASLQLLKERPRTALYRNKDDLKRLNQLTAENVAAKKAKREASKSYKEAKKLDNAAKNAKRKETASKIGRELLAMSNDVMQDKKMADAIGKIDSSLDKGMADIVRNAVYEETQKRKSDYRKAVGR